MSNRESSQDVTEAITREPERAPLVGELVTLWNTIEKISDMTKEVAQTGSVLATSGRRIEDFPAYVDRSSSLFTSRLNVIERWEDLFRDEIDSVRLVRNAVVHGAPVDTSVLEEAVDAEKKLLNLLQARLTNPWMTLKDFSDQVNQVVAELVVTTVGQPRSLIEEQVRAHPLAEGWNDETIRSTVYAIEQGR